MIRIRGILREMTERSPEPSPEFRKKVESLYGSMMEKMYQNLKEKIQKDLREIKNDTD